jgi:hypothetical protein
VQLTYHHGYNARRAHVQIIRNWWGRAERIKPEPPPCGISRMMTHERCQNNQRNLLPQIYLEKVTAQQHQQAAHQRKSGAVQRRPFLQTRRILKHSFTMQTDTILSPYFQIE